MDINKRFEHIINTLYNGNKRAFASAISISPSVIENVVGTRGGKPSYDVIHKVCANANISADWLITGEGDMLKTANKGHSVITEVVYKADPRDAELISSKNEIIETQKELISTLKQRINEFEKGLSYPRTDAFPSAQSVASTGGVVQSKITK